MKKQIRKALLSAFIMASVAIASTATVLLTATANSVAPVDTTTFEMVEGAAIRLVTPNGLRFIAEMDAATYADLTEKEVNVNKKMGMFIMPYEYLSDPSRYENGQEGVEGKDYEKITKKIDHVFFNSDGSVENKIYKEGDNYRANGVITDLMLKNYNRDFVGIAYIARTEGNGATTYTYVDIVENVNVRNAAYVAIEAYDDYKDDANAKLIMENYVYGAHLDAYSEGAISERYDQDGKLWYIYDEQEYTSLAELASQQFESGFYVNIENAPTYSLVGASHSVEYTLFNGDINGEEIAFNAHAIWSSSNEKVATVDKNGVVTTVGEGTTTITASFMGVTASFEATSIVFDGTLDSYTSVPTAYLQAGGRSTVEMAEDEYGGKALKVTAEMSNEGNARVFMTYPLMSAFFADPSVKYIAFDLKLPDDATDGKIFYHNATGGWTQYETGSFDASPTMAYESYYFSRSVYEAWIANGKENMRILNVGSGVTQGEYYFVDNIRGVTEEEMMADFYSFETGGIRTNNGNQPLYYLPNGGQWELGFSNIDSTTAKFTSDIVSDGNTAFTFTKKAGDTKLSFNHNTDTAMEKEMRAAGYVTFDIYAPEGSDACMKWGSYKSAPLKTKAWNTVYVQIDASNNDLIYLYDTTASTYVVDNIQFMTEEEYFEKAYSFESGASTIRSDSAAGTAGVFYWYAGADRRKNVYSMAVTGSPVDPHFDSEIVHSGEYSLSFKKTGNVNLQMRADSEAYARLHNGFSFWIYSTIGINGTGTSNFVNGNDQKLNGGAGINIPANTWTKVTFTKNDIQQATLGTDKGCLFLKIVGSTNGTYYIDDIQPLTSYTATFDAGIGSLATTSQEMVYDGAYTLPTPDSYVDFLGWYDESGNLVPSSGIWTYKGAVNLTARYSDKLSFEGGVYPTYMTMSGTASVVDMDAADGSKALRLTGSSTPGIQVPIEFLAHYFADTSVEYIAFSAKTESGSYNNFRRFSWRSNNGGEYTNVTYENDNTFNMIKADSWKTYYFSRNDYDRWVENSQTKNNFIVMGGVSTTDSLYVDYIRPMTQDEYLASVYSFEGGSVRNDGSAVYMYLPNAGGTWQWVFTQSSIAAASATSEIVSDGNRAVSFTLKPNVTSTFRFNSATCVMAQDLMKTGYYAFDLYIPEGANATLDAQIAGNYKSTVINEGGWRTVYSNTTTFMAITDTTGSTYAIDHMRSVTADEYNAAMNGFEMGTGGIRQTELAKDNVFYYYMNNGTDASMTRASLNFVGGSGATLSNPRFSNEQAHSGTTSLAFDKTNGAMSFSMHVDSLNYATLKSGFTFWIYSTVGLNGSTASNFVDGNGNKFGENGMTVPANKWTQITIEKKNFNGTTFLKLAGSTAGTIYIDDIEALPYVEPEEITYNTTIESEEDGVRRGVLLGASSHNYANLDALPNDKADSEDMSYIRFGGDYGLNDFLVFDMTGDNMPILSFFNTKITNSVYNQAEDPDEKGWIVANGMKTMKGFTYGNLTGATANRLNIIGPYKINGKFDDTPSGLTLSMLRTSYSPSPLAMANLQDVTTTYRVIVGWISNGSYMNLRIYVMDLTSGETVADHNINKNITKADWTGDIILYGHFGRETYVDNIYPIVKDKSIDDVIEMYQPESVVYKAEWDGDELTLAAGTYANSVNRPTSVDMSYIAFNGEYGLNDYVVFDFTGDNMPIISFFNNEVTNSVFNNATTTSNAAGVQDADARGWVWFNGLYQKDGTLFGGNDSVHQKRLSLLGYQKTLGFDDDSNKNEGGFRVNYGSASDIVPISIYTLKNVTDTYRMIIGIRANGTTGVYIDMYALNLVTGAQVYKASWRVDDTNYQEGSIALHGQFGKTTVLDKVYGVEEDTTLDALIAKYKVVKDLDYSDEAAVTLDRYAYSSLSNGQWTLDGNNMVSNPTDYRTLDSSYETYKNAGFNIILAQDMIGTDGQEWRDTEQFMDKANEHGLKVILTDWHLQILSAPIKVTSSGATKTDSTYVPWIIGTDANATSGPAKDYLDALSELGITPVSKIDGRYDFSTREGLDRWVYEQLKPYMNHPAFYGVMLADEPSFHNAYCYGEIYKSIKRVMPECYVQYNLLPMEQKFGTIQYRYPGVNAIGKNISNAQIENAYKQYVEGFLDSMGTDYIQYDDYPFKSAEEGLLFWTETVPYIDNTSLRNIQLIAEIAKERDLDVKVVTQSAIMRSGGEDGAIHIRQITEADARWLNNYLMGFGVKQINYFTYWTKASSSSSGEYFEDGGSFVNRDGSTTALYDFMKTIMADNTAFAPTISHFDYNESHVYGSNNDSNLNNDHISWSSSLTDSNYSFKWLTNVTTSKEFTLVTELYDAEKYNYMYMVMNTIDTYYGGTQNVTITLDSSVKKFYVYDQRGNRTLIEGNTYSAQLTAGQAIYIMPCAW